MSEKPTDDIAPRGEPDGPKAGLEKPIRDHLGEVLRAEYNRVADKPAYLGDTPLPPEFEHKLLQIEKSEDIREKGVEAIGEALGVLDPGRDSEATRHDSETEPPRT